MGVDVTSAQASVPADWERILGEIAADKYGHGGADALNSRIMGALRGAEQIALLGLPEVECAALGEMSALDTVPEERINDVLRAAAAGGHNDLVGWALEGHAVDVNATSGYMQDTTLQKAALGCHTLTMQRLIAAGAALNIPDFAGYTALSAAAYYGYAEAVKLLVDAKADPEVRCRRAGSTALMRAAAEGHAEVVELLLVAGRPEPTQPLRDLQIVI